jgi:hypothetical protein
MAASISNANTTNFTNDPCVTCTSDGSNSDIEVVIVNEEALSSEWLLNCDSIEEFYEFADTSLPIDVESSELAKDCSILNAIKTPKHSSVLVTLLPDSALKSYHQTYKDNETTLNTNSKSALKLNVVGNKGEIEKCVKQPTLSRSHRVDIKKVGQPGPQKSENVKSQESQSREHQFKCVQCNKVFGHKNHLEMHKNGHKQSGSYVSSPKQEIVIVKEKILTDDEGTLNDTLFSECDNTGCTSHVEDTKCLDIEDSNTFALENKANHGSNVVGVLAGSALENCNAYNNLKSDLGFNAKPVKLHLGNSSETMTDLQSHKNFGRSVKMNVKKVKQQLQLETKPVTAPSYAAVPVKHQFKCLECSETFELKSHLVMHEIGHEQYRRYGSFPVCHFSKPLQSHKPFYECKECNANFELKSLFTLHELSHEKQRTRPCYCKSTSFTSASDLCTCIERVCKTCGRRFFASFGLRNWTLCIKCLSPHSSTEAKTEEIQVEREPLKRNRNKISNIKFSPMLVDVKRLCCSCGKMSANVIKSGASWMCYDCFNARLKYKNVNNFLGLSSKIVPQKTAGNSRLNCTYCLKLYPLRSDGSYHQCFHKSVYLKGCDADDFKIGQRFLLHSTEKPIEPSFLQNELIVWNQSASFDDFNEREDEQEGEMVIDTTEASDVNDGPSVSNVILCDKTGELIDLRCEDETSVSHETRKYHTEGENGQRNSR